MLISIFIFLFLHWTRVALYDSQFKIILLELTEMLYSPSVHPLSEVAVCSCDWWTLDLKCKKQMGEAAVCFIASQ